MSQPHATLPQLRPQGTGQQLIVDGRPFLMLAGEVHNSSASSLAYMEPVWDRLTAMGLNTVIVPLYWELIEPEEGAYDFRLLDGLVEGARKRDLYLVLLWFASWKNATSSYAPGWVKVDPVRFPRMQLTPGRDSNALSCFGPASRAADARAFAAVMKRLCKIDGDRPTVLAMQVENETGVLGAPRDRSPLAEATFAELVPDALIDYISTHHETLRPELRENWEANGARTSGSWPAVFGADGPEVFMAWHIGRYVDAVAEAGMAEYSLPMVANAWLKVNPTDAPGFYPSGGPVYTMLDVWKAAAPHIDVLAPDIYAADFRGVCAAYTRPDNPLLIPEAHRDARAASTALYAFGQHGAICFAPFGVDSAQVSHPLTDTYRLLAEMMPLLCERQGTRRMAGFLQQADDERWEVELGGYTLHVHTRWPLDADEPPCGGLALELGDGEFVLAGRNLWIEYGTAPGRTDVEFLWLEEGTFQDGEWVPGRRLNGDETAHGRTVKLGPQLTVCRLKLNQAVVPVQHQERMMPS